VALVLTSCNYEDVDVKEVKGVKVNTFDAKGIELTATLQVHNPNGYKVQVTRTNADLFIDGKKAGKVVLLHKVIVPARTDMTVDAHLRADFDNGSLSLLPMLLGAAMRKKIDIRAAGTLRAKSFVIGHNFPFDETHQAKF
jgi:LEA14-like dessication related protein